MQLERPARKKSRTLGGLAKIAGGQPGIVDRPNVWPGTAGVVSRRDLLERLGRASRVTVVSAPAGSGKTVLLRSWIRETGLGDSAAWVSVQADERDEQQFWLSILDALRGTAAGSARVHELTPAPGLDTEQIVARLLQDLDSLEDRIWLVIDDFHELRSTEALRQFELLLMRAPAELRFILVTRRDLGLGLHRLRLEGGLSEIRTADLRFTGEEARALFHAAGVELSDPALALLHGRTEGWAAGLRLAALSLVGHPNPERFAAEFSGSEGTVAEYLLAEVLDRQPEQVKRLLLRTSVLERVSGPLADRLTGGQGSERILQELEQANAFVVSLDAGRTWFRYHRLFADLLALELRRIEPGNLSALHQAAADWFAQHEYPVEAVRHAQATEDWALASSLLADHWFGLRLDGHRAAAHALLAAFPGRVVEGDPELMLLRAADEVESGSLEEAERYLDLASKNAALVPAERRDRFELRLGTRRLRIARRRGNLPVVLEEARHLLAPAEAPAATQLGIGEEQRAIALIELGIAETWSYRSVEAERHLEQGVALARQIKRPYLELVGLAHGTQLEVVRSLVLGAQRSREAIDLAERHGWGEEPVTGVAYAQLASAMLGQGRLDEAEESLERAERTLRAELEPAVGMTLRWLRGGLERARGRPERALGAFQAGERLAELLHTPHVHADPAQAAGLHALVRLGQTDRVEAILTEIDEQERDTASMRAVIADLRLAGGDPQAAIITLAPAIDGSLAAHRLVIVESLLLEAIARDRLGDQGAVRRALESALDLAEPDGLVFPFFLHPVRELLERHSRYSTTHAALVAEILDVLAGNTARLPLSEPEPLPEPLSEAETRVLRYLPTNLSQQEIASELYVSVHTIRTHIKHLYGKLGAHGRAEAVERARGLGLLAPSLHKP